jgi:hypothetical protein
MTDSDTATTAPSTRSWLGVLCGDVCACMLLASRDPETVGVAGDHCRVRRSRSRFIRCFGQSASSHHNHRVFRFTYCTSSTLHIFVDV